MVTGEGVGAAGGGGRPEIKREFDSRACFSSGWIEAGHKTPRCLRGSLSLAQGFDKINR